jgi:hypothetical protein
MQHGHLPNVAEVLSTPCVYHVAPIDWPDPHGEGAVRGRHLEVGKVRDETNIVLLLVSAIANQHKDCGTRDGAPWYSIIQRLKKRWVRAKSWLPCVHGRGMEVWD